MIETKDITSASFSDFEKMMLGQLAGTTIEHEPRRGGDKNLWVDKTCRFERVPAGIKAERQFTGENTGRGFCVVVTPKGGGIVQFVDGTIMTKS